jgi:prepilin-type N-terminal cleavage/methylation domain-containing protein
MKSFLLKLRPFLKNNRGMTLVEVLIALAIGAFICTAAIGILTQVLILPPRAGNDMLAMRQVQNAGYYISQDGVQSQNITATAPSGFPLYISFVGWPENVTSNPTKTYITYSLIAGNILQRLMVVKDEKSNAVISQSQLSVADHISSITAQYSIVNKLLTVTVTARIDTATENRTYQISPRSR